MTSSAISAARTELVMPIHQHMLLPALIGPHSALGPVTEAPVHLLGRTRDPVKTDFGPSVVAALAVGRTMQ